MSKSTVYPILETFHEREVGFFTLSMAMRGRMKGNKVQEIREKLGFDRHQFAECLCLSGYRTMMNIEHNFRKPNKLAIRLLRYLDDQPKKKALEFLEEFKGYEPK